MSDINYPGDRPLNSATDSVTVTGSITSSGIAAIDQTTPGVTNGVQVNAPLPVGSNVIGAVAIDQTTPGTTNGVEIVAALPAGANVIGSVDQNGTWTVDAVQSGTWTVDAVQSGTWAVDQNGSWSVDAVQSGTWTVDATQSGTWAVDAVQSGTWAVDQSGSWSVDAVQSGTWTVDAVQSGSWTVAATQSGSWDIVNITGTVSLPTGAATAAKQPALGTAGTASSDVITVQGIASMTALKVDGSAVTQPVSIASFPASSGRSKVLLYRNDYTSVNLTTSAYVEVAASSAAAINRLYIADTSGSAIILATGAAGSEVEQLYIGPGGNEAPYELNIPASTRIAIKALDVTATSGQIIITALS